MGCSVGERAVWRSVAIGRPQKGSALPLPLLSREAPCWGWWPGGRWAGPLGDHLPCQLFKGKFYYCEGTDTRNISTRAECRAAHYRWVRRKYNFDNLGQVGRGQGSGEEGRGGQERRGWLGAGPDLESPEVHTQAVTLGGLALVFWKQKWQGHGTPELRAGGPAVGEACGVSRVGGRVDRKQ